MDNATEKTDAAEAAEAPNAAVFGEDELGKLQNILLGDHARRTVDRIDTLEQALLGVIDDLRGEMRDRVDELEKKIAAEADTRTTAVGNIKDRVDSEAKDRTKALKDLTKDLRSTESDLALAIESASGTLTDNVAELRSVTADLAKADANLAQADADLTEAKVDRSVLASLLSAAVAGLEDSPK